jgi:hypothetical protein
MGGSEEAVVYLARELSELGSEVTVYNERPEQYSDNPVGDAKDIDYYPWTEINPNDTFDTFVAWRDPSFLEHITAKVKLCDVHDALQPGVVYQNAEWVDKYLFKSKYHRSLYPKLPDDKALIISNGIVRQQFEA